jgi:AbrB family looped-hinge helix DNA binding protein
MKDSIRITSKGQVTLPAWVRRALNLREGDELMVELRDDGTLVCRPIRRRRLSEFAGALPATRPFPGTSTVRDEVGRRLGEAMREAPVVD